MLDAQIKLGDLVHIKPERDVCLWRANDTFSLTGVLNKGCTYAIINLTQIKKLPYKASNNGIFRFYFYYDMHAHYVVSYDLHVLDFVVRK